MTDEEQIRAYHHALQFWWNRAVKAEAKALEYADEVVALQEANRELRETVEALHY